MNEKTYLGGRVAVVTLPEFQGVPPGGGPSLKRLRLPQGAIAQIHQGGEGMRYIAWVEFRSGGVRGNHVHARKREHIYLVAGEVEVLLEDTAGGGRETVRLSGGDSIFIPPGIAHAVRTVVPGHGIEFSPEPLMADDTQAYPVVS